MNRSKIEWCDHTWNPITGCRHNCSYCYARAMTVRFAGDVRLNKMAKADYTLCDAADGGEKIYILDKPMINETGKALVYPFDFEPTYHRYRLNMPQKLKMGNNIFVGAMSDVFGSWIPENIIKEIFDVCLAHPEHNYLFLTKNSKGYITRSIPKGHNNMFYGMSITREAEIIERINGLPAFGKKFVSIEPLLEDINLQKYEQYIKCLDWIIIGAETGIQKQKIVPQLEWIKKIIAVADSYEIPVFMKDSLIDIVGENNMRREYPNELTKKKVSEKLEKRWFDSCCKCKSYLKKNEMITLLARSKRHGRPKQFGFMCKECFEKFCKKLELDIPQLDGIMITFEDNQNE